MEFTSHAAAERVLQTYNGTLMPQTEQAFRLNWASFGVGEKRIEGGSDHSIFVGDLAIDVTDYVLQETFRSRYPSVRGAKVIIDPITNRSKGYGFVRFADESEKNRAMAEMNGVYCSSRPMRINAATTKKGLPQTFFMQMRLTFLLINETITFLINDIKITINIQDVHAYVFLDIYKGSHCSLKIFVNFLYTIFMNYDNLWGQ